MYPTRDRGSTCRSTVVDFGQSVSATVLHLELAVEDGAGVEIKSQPLIQRAREVQKAHDALLLSHAAGYRPALVQPESDAAVGPAHPDLPAIRESVYRLQARRTGRACRQRVSQTPVLAEPPVHGDEGKHLHLVKPVEHTEAQAQSARRKLAGTGEDRAVREGVVPIRARLPKIVDRGFDQPPPFACDPIERYAESHTLHVVPGCLAAECTGIAEPVICVVVVQGQAPETTVTKPIGDTKTGNRTGRAEATAAIQICLALIVGCDRERGANGVSR